MITGCNTNIRHREMVFHVQTEDSGRANPHIISHVYHGGTIVGSRKQDYSDAMESPDLDREVRKRIEEQHKSMLKALRRGEFDQAIDERLTPGVTSPKLRKLSTEGAAEADVSPVSPAAAEPTDPAEASQTGAVTGSVTTPQIDTEAELSSQRPVTSGRDERPRTPAAFGESVDAQKPLDEVILEYLVEKARERSSDRRPPPKKRTKE